MPECKYDTQLLTDGQNLGRMGTTRISPPLPRRIRKSSPGAYRAEFGAKAKKERV